MHLSQVINFWPVRASGFNELRKLNLVDQFHAARCRGVAVERHPDRRQQQPDHPPHPPAAPRRFVQSCPAHAGDSITLTGERFDGRSPAGNVVSFLSSTLSNLFFENRRQAE